MSFKYLTLLLATTSMSSFADVGLPSGMIG